MTDDQSSGATWQGLLTEAVTVFTSAAQFRREDGTQSDFGKFDTLALVATAANVGGVDRLLAGRPGSWEAVHVREIVDSTVPDELLALLPHRTAPIVVPMNVAQLLEDQFSLPSCDDVINALWASVDEGNDQDSLETDLQEKAIRERFAALYTGFAEQFTQAVESRARQLAVLRVPVVVNVDTDPQSAWWDGSTVQNPDESTADPFAWMLWRHEVDATPVPDPQHLVVDQRVKAP